MESDTIAAIATALGESGIGVVRLSGPRALAIAGGLARTRPPLEDAPSHTIHHAWLREEGGELLDEALVLVMHGPKTYTGEDVVELTVHGGSIPARRVLRAALRGGARLAERGEFTKRAFLNGRIDLSQAEAVADVVAARTERSADVALSRLAGKLARRTTEVENRLLDLLARLEVNLDLNEDVEAVGREEIGRTLERCRAELEELRARAPLGRRLREGATVVLLGRPNVGKSSLFNALLEDERALVSETPGTTRDFLEAWLDIEGVPVRLVDTAGLRDARDAIEAEGVARAAKLEKHADLRVVVFDLSSAWTREDEELLRQTSDKPRILVGNKNDLAAGRELARNGSAPSRGSVPATMGLSARTGEGLKRLREEIARSLLEGVGREPGEEIIPSERHEDAIRRAVEALARGSESWRNGSSEELLAADVRDGATALGEITGRTVGAEVLDRIFSKFCIGK